MKHKLIILIAPCLIFLSSCDDFFDRDVSTHLTEEIVFTNYKTAIYVAAAVYADLPDGFAEIWASGGSAMMASATDEAEFAVQTHTVQRFNTGSWLPSSLPDNPISKYYESIRKANNFLKNADRIDYDAVKYDPSKPGEYEAQLADIEQWKVEVKLLRAYFLFELIKRFGGMPITNDIMFDQDSDYSTIERKTLGECVDNIIEWCDYAAERLPAIQDVTTNLGRLTSGAAKAIKSQVLLYAASDLWNDPSWAGGYAHPLLISLPTGDRNTRWKAAADAAKAVIDMEAEAGYGLDTYSSLFSPTTHRSKEVIFCRRAGASNSFELVNVPIGFDRTTGGNCPSQNLVDAFQLTDGTDFDWSNPTNAANPYINRDPRLSSFVVLNNTHFKGRAIESWTGGRDGSGVRNATPTGYYLKKYVNPDLDLVSGTTSVHSWVLIRLAEIYLNYIEALNEYDPGNADITKYYDMIRSRVSMPGLPDGLSQAQVRELIRQERFVELCFEGKRWFDLRRWMKGDELDKPLRAVEITKTGDNFQYSPYQLENRVFDTKMYFYPISQGELNKLPHWPQNPLW